MDEPMLRQLLADVRAGEVSADEAVAKLRRLPFADLGFARVDHHRALRQGLPEAVYGPHKTPEQVAGIVAELLDESSGPVVLTRASGDQVAAATGAATARGHEAPDVTDLGRAGAIAIWRPAPARPNRVLVLTAGTADLPVAHECERTLFAYGYRPQLLADCGVAGLHRLLATADELADADAIVVVAGMEGALASLVGGITSAPVVAVPTSVGYGAALEGVTALLAMLSSCASGITVVGIDNGFGAASAIARMLR